MNNKEEFSWTLNEQIESDTYSILDNSNHLLRLHKNSLFPWLILVPKVSNKEIFLCSNDEQSFINNLTIKYASMLNSFAGADKINIASLGNVVSQLHIHIIARFKTDAAWPNPIWGYKDHISYDDEKLNIIIDFFNKNL